MTQKFFWNNTCFLFFTDKARLVVDIWSTAAVCQPNKKIIRLEILLFSKIGIILKKDGELQYESNADRLEY